MARIRSIKPSFFTSETVATLSHLARLTFIGLWTHCDDDGRCVDNIRLIRAAIWPLEDRTLEEMEDDLCALCNQRLITRYTIDGKQYIEVTNWKEHQKIDRKTDSKLPPPPTEEPLDESSSSSKRDLTEVSPQERKGKEGNREQGKGEEGKGVCERAREKISQTEPLPDGVEFRDGSYRLIPIGTDTEGKGVFASDAVLFMAKCRDGPATDTYDMPLRAWIETHGNTMPRPHDVKSIIRLVDETDVKIVTRAIRHNGDKGYLSIDRLKTAVKAGVMP